MILLPAVSLIDTTEHYIQLLSHSFFFSAIFVSYLPLILLIFGIYTFCIAATGFNNWQLFISERKIANKNK
jgi:hypothetical protein